MIYNLHHRMNRARFRVIRTVNQAFDPGMDERSGTHCARLNCSKELTLTQAVVANSSTGLAQGDDLGVSGGIALGQVAIAAASNDYAAAHHDGAHRNFTGLQRALRGAESFFHK
jgi:hypothetical protein